MSKQAVEEALSEFGPDLDDSDLEETDTSLGVFEDKEDTAFDGF